jgi:uncharacterized membrane protein YkoI
VHAVGIHRLPFHTETQEIEPMFTQTASSRQIKHLAFVAILLAAPAAFASATLKGHEYQKETKVSLEVARASALKASPGKIVDEELEREGGGSGLRYSFDIKNGKVTHEVGVDAMTGAILENAVEGKNPD